MVDKIVEILKEAKETIKIWHGDIGWDFYQNSPEMKRLNEAIENTAQLYSAGEEELATEIVDAIAYKQYHEEQGDDYIEKIWIVREILKKLTRPVVTEEEIAEIIEAAPKRYGRVTDGMQAAKAIKELIDK